MSEKVKNIFFAIRGRLTLKRVLVTVLVALGILLPTIIAVIYIHSLSNSADIPTARRINTVILYDVSGDELYREEFNARESGDTSLVSIFNTINNNLIPSEKISESIATEPPITAKLIGTAEEKTLTCYFSFTQGASYCVDGSGAYFKIPADDSERFLSSEFAETLYKDSVAPSLSTADGDTVIPQDVEWYYRSIDGVFMSASKNEVTSEQINYHVMGGIALSFDLEPDICNVEIADSSDVIFSGSMSELSAFKLASSTMITVKVNAEWRQTESRRFYGASVYTFDITVHNRAEFSLSKTRLSAGEYAVLKATYINDISKFDLSCEGFELTPNIMLNGETAYAIIPCPASLDDNCKFKVTVSYGIATQSFTLTVDEAEYKKQYALNLAAKNDGLTDQASDTAAEYIFGASGAALPTLYGYLSDNSFGSKYGDSLCYYTCYFRADGHGMNVCAVSSGRVVGIKASSVLGTCVTVDVGLGTLFCYTQLSEADVSIGDYVTIGDCIGKSGLISDGASDGFAITVICNGYVLNFNCLPIK